MKVSLNKDQIERYSRQIVLKNIGASGQKKIIQSKILIVGMGGLGCPVAEFLVRAGVGLLGIVDSDNIDLSNIHRQSLYNMSDLRKSKVSVAKSKLKKINPSVKINCYKMRLNKNNYQKIIKEYDYIVDGSDNFKTKFLVNDFCKKNKKILFTGAISKFDGHIFTFDFKNKKTICIRNFFQENEISDEILNCEFDVVLGTVAGMVGVFLANEILKKILNIGKSLDGYILIVDFLSLNFRKVKLNKIEND